ncbi:exported protein of unknown function [Magnetospirillum sp. XM-1]|uniref:hypothetical protein n=1 Tax=Magnetospirillum sp. XM-1 TaxID=1663591 RepID=UPI00073DC275|nr:hypothetical protein [Magnetospirillum sp. XM-1]CUW38790.1 exported protein of unknown function [Magnetospirillum sp. XM-1]
MFDVASFTLGSSLAASGTATVSYPSGRSKGSYVGVGNKGHVLVVNGNTYVSPTHFALTFNANASNITLTWGAGMPTIASGTTCSLQINRLGPDDYITRPTTDVVKVINASVQLINLGSPNVADADGVAASQSVTIATTPLAVINGALATSGVATFDVPRNVVAAWTGTAVLTVTGTDEFGNTVVESSASGTSLAGKKAFKTVTSASFSANVTSATIGTGDVLGLPVYLPATGLVLHELEDGATATAGTVVAGVTTKATATTGDVRGTYDPNSACDGSKGFVLVAAIPDASNRGVSQYAG